MRVQRIDQIEEYIIDNKTATLEELCEKFDISKNTIRRDINELVRRGNIEKVYGGVTVVEKKTGEYAGLVSYNERNIKNHEIKDRICRLAATYITSGDSIFIDTGTTTINIIDYIEDKENVTIITNSIEVAHKALSYPMLRLIVLPGVLNHKTASLVGSSCIESLKKFNIKKSFMACTCISLTNGVSNATHEEYEVKKEVLKSSGECYLLADHTKFNQTSLCTFGELQDFNYILTDITPSAEYLDVFKKHGIHLGVTENKIFI